MRSLINTTLSRDCYSLIQRRLFWWMLAVFSFLCALIYIAFLEDFLAIQSQLRAKNVSYGIIDIVLIPYIKTLGLLSLVLIISLCARLFHHEHGSVFAPLFRSTQPHFFTLLLAKGIYITVLSAIIVCLIALPVLVSCLFFEVGLYRIFITLVAHFVLLSTVGLMVTVFSQTFNHSILVMLASGTIIVASELIARLVVEPAWLSSIVMFFSPVSHINRITTGMVTLSDGVFFIFLWALFGLIAERQFRNSYLWST